MSRCGSSNLITSSEPAAAGVILIENARPASLRRRGIQR
jgi:hypothetical protein